GQSTVRHNNLSTLYATAGRIGRLDTGQIQGFDFEDGEQYGLGYSRQLAMNWRAGMHMVNVNGSNNTTDHQSAATAVQYQSPDENNRYVGHVLADSEGQYGVWADGDNRINRWRHRYGLFRLEPELLWSDNEPNNDQQGGYLRSEMTTLRYDFTTGLDLTQTNIDDRANRAGNNLYNGFVNGSWRMDRKTSLGGTLTLRGSDPRDDLTEDDTRNVILSSFVSHAFPVGTTRLQLLASRLEEGGDTGNGFGVIWDQDWNATRNLMLSSTLSHETENGLDDSENRSLAALLFRHDVTAGLRWNGDISYTHIDKDSGSSQNTTNASLAVAWQFLPNWDASLRVTYNRVDNALENTGADFSDDEKTLLFNIRYSESRGQPFLLMGEDTNASGYGAVTGLVFFDENGDGRRQAGERAASGVFVYLDRRYQAVTDRDGRYVFDPVPAGAHDVILAQEDLPLPWGLLDETPRPVQVEVRDSAVLDFGLRRLNE
ncbi:MAG: carboxypeptidase-like regulatory domain-containing protein, partial [Gammaproteobacteria bacterium]|nr:carboxypeptidase-like regulatory domain-containing protein [Gammaproteobacteria bacterium]